MISPVTIGISLLASNPFSTCFEQAWESLGHTLSRLSPSLRVKGSRIALSLT